MKLLSIDVGIKNLAFCLLNIIPASSASDIPVTVTTTASIILWDVIDICHSEAEERATAQRAADHPKCSHSLAKRLKSKTATASPNAQPTSSSSASSCSANAAFYYYDTDSVVRFICKRHANKMRECEISSSSKYILPTPETLNPKKLLTGTSAEKLLDFCKRHDACDADWAKLSKSKVREKKTVLQDRVRHILKTRYIHAYETLGELLDGCPCPCPQQPGSLPPTTPTTPTPEHVSLITVGSNIISKFDKLFYNHVSVGSFGSQSPDRVIIENQISPIATRMKTVQGMVTQYFLMRGVAPDRISYISAANKLKPWTSVPPTHVHKDSGEECESEIDTYDDRKKLGIASTRKLLQSGETGCGGFRIIGGEGDGRSCGEWLAAFETHKKKDDMADSLLQGLSYATAKK